MLSTEKDETFSLFVLLACAFRSYVSRPQTDTRCFLLI